jgi:hypothetical protein
METIENMYTKEERIAFKAFKNYIKGVAAEQQVLKNQRKTVKLVGKRTMSPSDATMKHFHNREHLRVLYAAYGILRGKNYSEIENHYPDDKHPLNTPYMDKCIERVLKEHKFLNEED